MDYTTKLRAPKAAVTDVDFDDGYASSDGETDRQKETEMVR